MLSWLGGNLVFNASETLAQQIHQIPTNTVNTQQIEVVNMQITLFMRPTDFRRIDLIQPVGLGNFRRNVIIQTLQTIAHVGIFFDFPVQVINVFINQIDVRIGRNFTQFFMLVAVDDVGFGSFLELRINQRVLDDVLDFLNTRH